jgi:hypothetical protein
MFLTAATYGIRAACWEAIRRLMRVTAWLVIAFMLLWGYNYRRTARGDGSGWIGSRAGRGHSGAAVSQSVALRDVFGP